MVTRLLQSTKQIAVALLCLAVMPVYAVQFCNTNNSAGWSITDNSTTNAPVTVNMGSATGPILDVNVTTDITHTWVGDLDATVTSPDGASSELFNRPMKPPWFWGCGGNNLQVVLDDEAGTGNIDGLCGGGVPTISGTYEPQDLAGNPLADIDNGSVNGVWNVAVADNATQDQGSVDNVCVNIQAAAITLVHYVSTTAACPEQQTSLTVPNGTNVFNCFILTNSGSETFNVAASDVFEDLGADLSGLAGTYNAADTQVVYTGPYVAGGAEYPLGTTSHNAQATATGAAPGFPLVAQTVSTVTVSSTPPPANGNKPLYLDNATPALSRSQPTVSNNILVNGNSSYTWTLSPALTGALSFNTTTIPITVRMRRQGGGNPRRFSFTLASAGSTVGLIGTTGTINQNLTNSYQEYSYSIPVTGLTNLAAGSQITLTIETLNNRRLRVEDTDTINSYSRFVLDATTVISVDNVTHYDATYNGGSAITGTAPGSTFYTRATISDPFGDYDITSARFDLINLSGSIVSTSTVITPVTELPSDDSGIAIFEQAFTIPGAGPQGIWAVRVTTFEGSEGTVTHTWSAPIMVGYPSITILKSASGATAAPGDTITYTISVTNNGVGTASNTTITDAIPNYTTYVANSTRLNGITVAGDGATSPLAGGLLIDDNLARGAGVAASGDIAEAGSATITFQVTVN
ncbi:MAG: hypothetical protein BMS9Abin36_1776 [Gammaproteobacteria bacterium]|nr:MAG: hypothetical protein BMS9Abin36_1776 [Gammaproteobacteria bacterium]